MTDKQKIYDKIETEVLDHFDFAEVHKVMELLEWTWHDAAEADGWGVPAQYEIRQKARRLLRECADRLIRYPDQEEQSVSTGGLKATAYRYLDLEEGAIFDFRLVFELTTWETF